ncbi:hypothetical protein ACH3VR_12950 [Microbacterium sp. B2969]|uniref:Uncharacterized protein n=1 Tax=Microbacterium alkaliflavum TaxID=3248839 RepID=A0ABW7QAM8_9MICO
MADLSSGAARAVRLAGLGRSSVARQSSNGGTDAAQQRRAHA